MPPMVVQSPYSIKRKFRIFAENAGFYANYASKIKALALK